jgi:hypothetical protein
MAQTTSNGEWMKARKQTRVECEIAQGKQNQMVPTVTKDTKDIIHNQLNQVGKKCQPVSTRHETM